MIDPSTALQRALEEHSVPLSDAGAARRDHLRATLAGVVVRRRRIRRALRAAALLALAGGAFAWWPRSVPQPRPPHAPEPSAIAIVHDDPSLLTAWRARPSSEIRIERIDDERALELLAVSDQPGGFIRIAGKVLVAPHAPVQPE